MASIVLDNVNLDFKLYQPKGIKDILVSRGKQQEEVQTVHALKNISLSLKDGDRLGIIGHNGAGKSTLLKMLGGIYTPTSGSRTVDGKTTCLFELATGFEMEGSGYDNIELRGLMLGMNPKQIEEKKKEIAEFSELGSHLYRPVKYYSSGMFLRLAFSISTALSPEILLLDEVVAAGDAGFIEKASKRLKDMIDEVNILVFVSHSMPQICSFCNKCIWMSQGEIIHYGDSQEVTNMYLESMLRG
ncbi:MAG: ABC transporter ATP-binding protein [Clostridia bacterium]|nr:ABC transporter ATP-binding protein [Clostridia bacterium]